MSKYRVREQDNRFYVEELKYARIDEWGHNSTWITINLLPHPNLQAALDHIKKLEEPLSQIKYYYPQS